MTPSAAAVWSADAPVGYRVPARNLSRYSANQIHDDGVARTFGYAGGLVAGTTVYAYLSHPLVAAWGLAWLARGTARLTLLRPVYDGDELSVEARLVGRSGGETAGEVSVELTGTTGGGDAPPVAVMVAGHAWGVPAALPELAAYPAAPLPAVRPAAAAAAFADSPLGSPTLDLDEAAVTEYAREVGDELDVYRGRDGVAHPGLLLQQANRALSENVLLGPWIHAASDVAHCGVARVGDRLSTRGRPVRVFERKGHRLVELDLLVVANDVRPIVHVRHAAIYEPRRGRDGSAGPDAA